MKHFLILIGGPGKFKGCDKAHDQTWLNYIVPMQLAAMRDYYRKQPNETVHWVVYEPPYKERWKDDSIITKKEKAQDDGYHLHSIRKIAADKVLKSGSGSYLERIKAISKKQGILYKGIQTPNEFWSYISTLKDGSLNRIWYSGHASGMELMLSLTHDNNCIASAFTRDTIPNTDLEDVTIQKIVKSKLATGTKTASKFYGCYTAAIAKKWHSIFSTPAEGATLKIDFGVINKPSNIVNILERIEQTSTSIGKPDWKVYK